MVLTDLTARTTRMITQLKVLLAKTKLGSLIAILGAFFAPIKPLLLIVGLMIFFDTITGLYKAYKLKTKITSRAASAIVSKMVLYGFAVISVFIIEKYIMAEFVGYFVDIPLFLTKITAATLSLIELQSINENYEAISGVSMWKKFKEFLARAKEVKEDISDLTEGLTSKKDDTEEDLSKDEDAV